VHYTIAFAVLTPVWVTWAPFPAAAALLALAFGDGPGGALGRSFGRTRYRLPRGKEKSLEGSVVVAIGAGLGALVAAWLFAPASADLRVAAWLPLVIGVGASLAEALSPRGLDNIIVPSVVFAIAALMTSAGSSP